MDFALSEEQQTLKQELRAFAKAELSGDLRRRDRERLFSRENWEKCAAKGILGSHVPVAHGGLGRDVLTSVVALEAVGYGCRDNGLTLALSGQMWCIQEPLCAFGTEEQKQKYLPRLCSGELIGADGITEESSGSDALSLRTTAEKTENGYVLNGRKTYIGMAPVCDLALVLAVTDPEMGKLGISAFLIEKGTPGFLIGAEREKLGLRTNPMSDLILENCLVGEEQRLGGEGAGMSLFSHSSSWERAFINAGHLGAMERLVEDCVNRVRECERFGQPIGKFQAVSHRIAEMRLRQETSRLLLYQAAWLKDRGETAELECSLANLQISESLLQSGLDAMRLHGAQGYLEEFEVERELRDQAGGVIYAGTSDIQRNLIASILGL